MEDDDADQKPPAVAAAKDNVDTDTDVDTDDDDDDPSSSTTTTSLDFTSWCQQGISPEGLREFRISLEGMTSLKSAQHLAQQLSRSQLFAKLGVYGTTADPRHHDQVMQLLFHCIQQSKSIYCLSMSSPMGSDAAAACFAHPNTLSSLKSLILATSTMTLDMAQQQVQIGLGQNTSIQDVTIEVGPDAESKRIFDTLLSSLLERDKRPLHKLCVVHEECLDEDDDDDSDDREGLLGILRHVIQQNKCPRELEMIGCDVVAQDLQVLRAYLQQPDCRLESLAINDALLKVTHIAYLAQGLAHNTSLTRLHLDCDQLDDDDLTILAQQGLAFNTTLHTFHVCGNRFTDVGIENFCQMWTSSSTNNTNYDDDDNLMMEVDDSSISSPSTSSALQHIDMGFNLFGPIGARRLLQAVAMHPNMQSLSIVQNDNLNYQGLEFVGQELPNIHLKTLNVSCVVNEDVIILDDADDDVTTNNQDGGNAGGETNNRNNNNNRNRNNTAMAAAAADAETKRLQQQARHQASQALLRGVQANVTLRDLDISYNKLSPDVEQQIRFYLELNKRGRCMLSNFFQLSLSVMAPILAKCGDDPKYMFYLIREQPLLVTRIINNNNNNNNNNNDDSNYCHDDDDDDRMMKVEAAVPQKVPPTKKRRMN